ncbi:MAG: 16S rRNA (cytosine(967)-C(5))-methyltransferase, partial [uncultured Solirubrobacteraceae bacterium]
PHGRAQRRRPHGRRRRLRGAGRLRPGPRRPAVLGPRDAALAPRRALAQGRRPARAARGAAGPDPARGRRRAAAGRHARLLDLHDLAGRERGRRRRLPRRASRLRGGRPAGRPARLEASACGPPPPDAPAPRRDGRLLHRPAAPRGGARWL